MSNADSFERKVEEALAAPKNMGELSDADAVGTVGSADCGDMLRMWIKFREEEGRKIIDKASFQTFGCQTAIAVASMATEMLAGKTVDQALAMSGQELAEPLGPLPPMKIHCAQLVEGALRSALQPPQTPAAPPPPSPVQTPGLMENFTQPAAPSGKIRIRKETEENE